MTETPSSPQVQIKADEKEMLGQYSNLVMIHHNPEEFTLHFVYLFTNGTHGKLVSSVIVTAATRNWALKAATEATGFATSCIGCAAEAGIDYYIPPGNSPDGRPGYAILICNPKKDKLKEQLIERIGECILTAPTTAVFNGFTDATEKLPVKLHFFGDGFEHQVKVGAGPAGQSLSWEGNLSPKRSSGS